MYYEEKMIGGVMHWRAHPQTSFVPYTLAEVSSRYQQLQTEHATLRADVRERAERRYAAKE